MPEWTSKKQVQEALKKARLHWAQVRKDGYDVDTPKYKDAQAECVRLDGILRRM